MMHAVTFARLLRDAAVGWWDDDVPRMAAAVAFYTLFSLAPLVIVAIMIAGVVFGEAAAAGQLVERLEWAVGRPAGEVIEAAIANANRPNTGVLATLISVLISLVAATGVFHELGKSLDLVWQSELGGATAGQAAPKSSGGASDPPSLSHRFKQEALELLKARFWAFTLVVGIGLSLLASLVASTILASMGRQAWTEWFWLGRIIDMVLSTGLGTLVFALIYKVLPASKVAWRDLWLGAFIAAFLFSIGRLLIGSYLAHSTVASVYGAAGALVVILVWTWCSAMVLLFGAEFCQAYARHQGRRIGQRRDGRPAVARTASEPPTSLRGVSS